VIGDDEFDSAELDWPQEAEARRRDGRPEQARRLAEAGLVDEPHHSVGRAVLALACLDLGDAAGARQALEGLVAPLSGPASEPIDAGPDIADEPFGVFSDPLEDLAENELDSAFSQVESETVEVWTTNRVAEAALRSVEEGQPEGLADPEEPDSPFATETVAQLLEQQGAVERAEAIRFKLESGAAASASGSGFEPDPRTRWIGTLEHWLDNLRRASR
jgi:hypothetical protein